MNLQTYSKFADLPLGELIPLTALTADQDRYGDYCDGTFCSTCGKNSARLRRADLWMMRREWGDSHQTRFYCRDHFPDDDNSSDGSQRLSRAPEVTCSQCFLRTPPGEECTNCGASL